MFSPSPPSPSIAISERKDQNSKQPINRLPPELLSRIFLIAEEGERVFRPRRTMYITCQELATRVCSRWREVALSTPSLWTYIHITRPPPNPLAKLFLERAGATTPLDINIEIRSRYCDKANVGLSNWRRQVNLMADLLVFLSSNGAGASRWKSLSVCVKEPEVLFRIIEFLNTEAAPALRVLYLKWKIAAPDYAAEDRCLSYSRLLPGSHSLSGLSLPNLHSVALSLAPEGFVLGWTSPLLQGLTRLRLTTSSYLIPLAKVKELLVASPQLESLLLDSEFKHTDDLPAEHTPTRIRLSSLRSLSVGSFNRPLWMLGVVQMIEAPAIHKFAFSRMPKWDDSIVDILKYISTGRLRGQDESSNTAGISAPIYPGLCELDISKIASFEGEVGETLSALPSVTRLCINRFHVDFLERSPLILPNLVHLKVSDYSDDLLQGLLFRRAEGGFPLRVVELPRLGWQNDAMYERPYNIRVKIVEHRDNDLGQDFDDSEEEEDEEDDWVLEDDSDGWLDGPDVDIDFSDEGDDAEDEDFDGYLEYD